MKATIRNDEKGMKESHNKSHEPKEEMKTIHDEKGIKESHMKRKQVIMKKVQRNS